MNGKNPVHMPGWRSPKGLWAGGEFSGSGSGPVCPGPENRRGDTITDIRRRSRAQKCSRSGMPAHEVCISTAKMQ